MPKKIIALANHKGGCGKTTVTRELSIYLASKGFSTLIIDTDPQANITKSLTDEQDKGLYEALTDNKYEIREIFKNLFLLPGNIKLSTLEKSLIGEIDAYTRLKELLEQILFNQFQYILIDTPPSLGVLTINALTGAAHFLIPMSPSIYTLSGTVDLLATVSKVRKNLNPCLVLLGVLINAFDSIPVITRQIRDEIEESFGEKVFNTVLSKSIKIEEAIADRSGVVSLKKAKVKDEIELIGEEFLKRAEGITPSIYNNSELKEEIC